MVNSAYLLQLYDYITPQKNTNNGGEYFRVPHVAEEVGDHEGTDEQEGAQEEHIRYGLGHRGVVASVSGQLPTVAGALSLAACGGRGVRTFWLCHVFII